MRKLKKMVCQLVVTAICTATVGMHVAAEEEVFTPEIQGGGYEAVTEITIPFEEIDPEHLIELDSLELAKNADDSINETGKSSQKIDEQQDVYLDTYTQYAPAQGKYDCYATYYYYNLLPNDGYRVWWDKMTYLCNGYLDNTERLENGGSCSTEYVEYPNDGLMEVGDLVDLFRHSNPQFYFLNYKYYTLTKGEKNYLAISVYDEFADGNARKAATKEFFENAQSYLTQITATDQPGQMKQINDLLCNNVSFNNDYRTEDNFSQSAFSTFCRNKTVCTGYTMACTMLCNAKGINCIGVIGTQFGGGHTWNKVNLNGNWYNMDIQMNDTPVKQYGQEYETHYVCYAFSDTSLTYMYTEDEILKVYYPKCSINSGSSVTSVGTIKEGTPVSKIQPIASPASTPTPEPEQPAEDTDDLNMKWYYKDGKAYWYENGVRQGTESDPKGIWGDGSNRGREIFDPESDGWYWLDACYDGAKACNKEVWVPYIYQNEAGWDNAEIEMNANNSGSMKQQVIDSIKNRDGKWVRYDENGKMYKGWYKVEGEQAKIYPLQEGNKYYYDYQTGLMAKGWQVIDGVSYYFDEKTGVLQE